MKIKDRIVLGAVAGLAGNLAKVALDEGSHMLGFSQRSFRAAAAGVWVSKKSEANNLQGQILGSLFDFGMGALGGIGIVSLFSKTGKDHVVTKGILSGVTIGSFLTMLLGNLPANKVKPKDAASNISYMASHTIYGIVASVVATKLGDPSLFKVESLDNSSPPKEQATEETERNAAATRKRQVVGSGAPNYRSPRQL